MKTASTIVNTQDLRWLENIGKDAKQAFGQVAGEHPREIQAADTDLRFVVVDIGMELMVDKLP